MQTFLPFESFIKCAQSLDNKRLNKQRVEAYQILKANLQGPTSFKNNKQVNTAWYNHPIVVAWRGYELSLANYCIAMCDEQLNRGYIDNIKPKIKQILTTSSFGPHYPNWLTNKHLHSQYRAYLIYKKPEHYRDILGWTEEPIDKIDYSLFR